MPAGTRDVSILPVVKSGRGITQTASCLVTAWLSGGVKRPEHEASLEPASSAEFGNKWSCLSISLNAFESYIRPNLLST